MPGAAYAPAKGCHHVLDAWCMQNCPHSKIEKLFARFDTNNRGDDPAWRCYGKSTLDASLMKYQQGDRYCTRHPFLNEELRLCVAAGIASPHFDSESAYGPGAQGFDLQQDPQNRARASQRAAMASTSPQASGAGGGQCAKPEEPPRTAKAEPGPLPAPVGAGVAACADAVPECSIWARYDECRQNPAFMHEECASSCRTCQGMGGRVRKKRNKGNTGLKESRKKRTNDMNNCCRHRCR